MDAALGCLLETSGAFVYCITELVPRVCCRICKSLSALHNAESGAWDW